MDACTVDVPARAGLVGHPSDLFGGAVLALPVPEVVATVEIEPSNELVIGDRVVHDLASLRGARHEGPSMLLTAAIDRLASWAGVEDTTPFTLTWRTSIPRSVGLAGSSALVIGALRAVARWWEVAIPDDIGPRLALEVETDLLGIAAGPQDRVVQWHATPVFMDFSTEQWQISVAAPPAPIELFVCWATASSRASQATHGPLRARRGEPEVEQRMAALAALARVAKDAVAAGDIDGLGQCMNAGFEHRRAVIPLDPAHVAMVDELRALGAPATYAGSGGAVVALAADDEPLRGWARERGFGFVTTTLA